MHCLIYGRNRFFCWLQHSTSVTSPPAVPRPSCMRDPACQPSASSLDGQHQVSAPNQVSACLSLLLPFKTHTQHFVKHPNPFLTPSLFRATQTGQLAQINVCPKTTSIKITSQQRGINLSLAVTKRAESKSKVCGRNNNIEQ